jgi:hypothetical protein
MASGAHRLVLDSQQCLLHAQRGGLQQPDVGTNGVALFEQQDVARHQFGAGNALALSVAHHREEATAVMRTSAATASAACASRT